MMKFRVRKNDHDHAIEFGANYFNDSVLNSLENIGHKQSETVKVPLHLSLDDLKSEPYKSLFITESIDDVVNRLQELTRPIKNNDGTIMPRKINIWIEYSSEKKGSHGQVGSGHACYLKSLTYKKINESLVDLELEFIGHRRKL